MFVKTGMRDTGKISIFWLNYFQLVLGGVSSAAVSFHMMVFKQTPFY